MLRFLKFIFYLTAGFLMTAKITIANPIFKKTQPKVLIVGDSNSELYLKYLKDNLEANYKVRTAENVEKGLSIWKSFKPDVIVTDMNMPLTFTSEYPDPEAGVIFLEESPKDKAKVILASDLFRDSPVTRFKAFSMADFTVMSKHWIPRGVKNIKQAIEKLLKSEEQPLRVKDQRKTFSKILIVEDNTFILENVEELFRTSYEVRTAENVEEGLSIWKSFKPDVVITDMNMPLSFVSSLPEPEAGVHLLEESPNDQAKVIIASSMDKNSPIMRRILPMVEHNVEGKINNLEQKKQLKPIIEKLLKSKEQPRRINNKNKCFGVFV